MKNLDQIRAANAIQHINDEATGANGGEVVKKVPTMIRENGILAVAAFAAEKKGNGKDYKNPGHKIVFDYIIEHLAHGKVNKLDSKMSLECFIKYLTDGNSAGLRDVASETMAYLNYLRRFVRKKGDDNHVNGSE
jgi:CRISPR/Cas system CMR-associated protein Cmr5 small subunit